MADLERHPFKPFLPEGAQVLFLGSFPPQERRWSIDFFYPNFINDFWRICGLRFYDNRDYFVSPQGRSFDKDRIVEFCNRRGIALFDTALAVKRLKDNASDKYLEIIEYTDINDLLAQIPDCKAIAATGQKSAEAIRAFFGCEMPVIGEHTAIVVGGRKISFWRMPSTSRAYPLPLERKAEVYKRLFDSL